MRGTANPTRLRGGSRSLRSLAGTLLTLALLCAAAPASGSETDQAYRYWGYFQLTDGAWSYAGVGPAQFTPADGAVDGWRYALVGASSTRTPRGAPTFEDVCGQTPTDEGEKRVAVVIDYGRDTDRASDGDDVPAAAAHCATLDPDANSAQALATVAQVREGDNGLICSISGYPSVGCTGPVDTADVPPAALEPDDSIQIPVAAEQAGPEATAASSPDLAQAVDQAVSDDGAGPLPWLVGVGLVAAIGALLATRLRQSRASFSASRQSEDTPPGGSRPESH